MSKTKEPKRNVYVGHRYVPKIMGEWDKSYTYEGLSIVTHKGASYTSKKRVPVGVDILDTDYWVVTGNYNAQVEYYREEVRRLDNTLNNRIDETNETLNKKVDQVNDSLKEREVSISQTPFNILPGKVNTLDLQEVIDFCIDNKLDLFIPSGEYKLDSDKPLMITGSITIRGAGKQSTFLTDDGKRSTPKIIIESDNVIIKDIQLNSKDTDSYFNAVIELAKGNNVELSNILFTGGHTAIASDPENNVLIRNLKILNCELYGFKHNIYLGASEEHNGYIDGVVIDGNYIHDSVPLGSGGDGIKTVKNIKNVRITNNIIDNMVRDSIDLFASGENIIIENNVLTNSGVTSIDIKSNTTEYPENVYGKNGENIIIRGNIISHNNVGVTVSQNLVNGDSNYFIIISENIIYNNERRAVRLSGKNITFTHNMVHSNCYIDDVSHIIEIGRQGKTGITSDVTVIGNKIINNGHSSLLRYGIFINTQVNDVIIKDNVIKNDGEYSSQKQYGGIYVNSETNRITIKDNKISNHESNISLIKGADVIGESVSYIYNDLLENFEEKDIILKLPSSEKIFITQCNLMLGEDISLINENKVYFNLSTYENNNKKIIGGISNDTTEKDHLNKYEIISIFFGTNSLRAINTDQVLLFTFAGSGQKQAIISPYIELKYITL